MICRDKLIKCKCKQTCRNRIMIDLRAKSPALWLITKHWSKTLASWGNKFRTFKISWIKELSRISKRSGNLISKMWWSWSWRISLRTISKPQLRCRTKLGTGRSHSRRKWRRIRIWLSNLIVCAPLLKILTRPKKNCSNAFKQPWTKKEALTVTKLF